MQSDKKDAVARVPVEAAPESHVRLSAARTAATRMGDAALVHGALIGQRAPAPAIVHRYRPLVRRILGASVRGADLEDGVQEVFVRCFRSLPRLRDPGSLRSFIVGITLRLAATERRRRRLRWRESLTATGELPEPASEDGADTRLIALRTRELLQKLKPDSLRVLDLRFFQENELVEVAEQMGVSLATAKRHLARASARVRAMAEGEPIIADYVRKARASGSVTEASRGRRPARTLPA